jgi:hypothetical protein
VTANVIDPRSVRGMWRTDEGGRDEMGRDTTMPDRQITYALMRLRQGGVSYAVMLDAAGTDCVVRVDSHFEGCANLMPPGWEEKTIRDVREVEFGALSGNGKRLPVIAVARACDVNHRDCGIPDSIFSQMPPSNRGLAASELQAVRSAVFSRGRRLFVQIVRLPPGSPAGDAAGTPTAGPRHQAR